MKVNDVFKIGECELDNLNYPDNSKCINGNLLDIKLNGVDVLAEVLVEGFWVEDTVVRVINV